MNQRTSPPSKNTPVKGSRFPIQLSRREAFLWLGVASFAMLWMFTLGVIVGRGHSPVRFDIERIKHDLTALKEQALKREDQDKGPDRDMTPDKMSFDFYEALTDKKEEARSKSVQEAQEAPSEALVPPEPIASAKVEEARALPRTSENKQEGKAQTTSAVRKPEEPTPFTIQVASLHDMNSAQELVSTLKRKGYIAYLVKVQIPEKGTHYRVRVGHFKNRQEAGQVLAKIKRGNPEFEPMVIGK